MNKTQKYQARREVIEILCQELGGRWPNGQPATEEQIEDAARNPEAYSINEKDLDAAAEDDVRGTLRMRLAWGLSPF